MEAEEAGEPAAEELCSGQTEEMKSTDGGGAAAPEAAAAAAEEHRAGARFAGGWEEPLLQAAGAGGAGACLPALRASRDLPPAPSVRSIAPARRRPSRA